MSISGLAVRPNNRSSLVKWPVKSHARCAGHNRWRHKNMKYMLLIYQDEQVWNGRTEPEHQQIYEEYRQLIEELKSKGKYLAGDQLQPAITASTVRVRDGKQMITDGPFAETREQIGGFFMIDANDLA